MGELKKLKESGHGRYDEITDEKLALQTTVFVYHVCQLLCHADNDRMLQE